MKKGWTYKQLKDVTNKISDGSHNPPKGIAYSEYPMLSSKNILFDDFNYDSPRYLSKEDFDIENKRTDISDGDVLLTIVGTVGRTCCVQNPFIPFTLQRSVAVLKPKKEILISRFLMYALYSLSDLWENEAKGAAQKGVYLKQLATVSIPTPPISEQERIVERLDAAFAQIDELKSNAERQLAEARALFQSALTQAMQPKPGWQEKPLKEITTKIGSGATPRGGKAVYIDNGVALIRSMNVHNGFFKYDNLAHISDEAANLLNGVELKQNDVLFNITGASIARCCVVPDDVIPARVNQHVAIIKPITDIVYPRFLSYVLMSKTHQKELLSIGLSGSTRQALTKKDLENHVVSLPSPDEQRVILDYLDNYSLKVRELERISRKTAAECDALKQALLRQIFE